MNEMNNIKKIYKFIISKFLLEIMLNFYMDQFQGEDFSLRL